MIPPLVTCCMRIYNRAPDHLHLVNEAVESFLRQDYPYRELIILNDTPGQTLTFSRSANQAPPHWVFGQQKTPTGEPTHGMHPIKVINVHHRFPSMGLKCNALFAMARGLIVVPWDDDDISLPGRLSQAVQRLYSGFPCPDTSSTEPRVHGPWYYFNPQRSFYLDPNHVLHTIHSHGYCHNASAFTKEAWEKVGGYDEREEMSGCEDACIDPKLKALGRTAPPLSDDPKEWQYIYRFGVSPCHASAPAIGQGAAKYEWIGSRPITPGTFEIHPRWDCDYLEIAHCASAH